MQINLFLFKLQMTLVTSKRNKSWKRFSREYRAEELKHRSLSRKPAHQERIVEFISYLVSDLRRSATWIAHKEYAAVTFVVDWWIEPLTSKMGFNLYKDGANQALANMLFICLEALWDSKFRRNVLLAFQRMFRSRTKERFDECNNLIHRAKNTALFDDARSDIIQYLWSSFNLLGHKHVLELPERVMDLALPGLVRIGHSWREKHEGPWELVHDQSSNMAKKQWLWDRISNVDFDNAQFDGPHGPAIFPMNVIATKFVDSNIKKQIQLCDILAGATSAWLRLPKSDPYREKLEQAGINKLVIDGIYPSSAVSPEELGKKGWDGNEIIEWIGKANRHSSYSA